MAQKSGLIGALNDECTPEEIASLKIGSNGMPYIPDNKQNDRLICKKILRLHMSNEEIALFKALRARFSDTLENFEYWTALIRTGEIYDSPHTEELRKAIQSGWFDEFITPTVPKISPKPSPDAVRRVKAERAESFYKIIDGLYR